MVLSSTSRPCKDEKNATPLSTGLVTVRDRYPLVSESVARAVGGLLQELEGGEEIEVSFKSHTLYAEFTQC